MHPREDSLFQAVRAFGAIHAMAERCGDCGAVRLWPVAPHGETAAQMAVWHADRKGEEHEKWTANVAELFAMVGAIGNPTPWRAVREEHCKACEIDEDRAKEDGFNRALGAILRPGALVKVSEREVGVDVVEQRPEGWTRTVLRSEDFETYAIDRTTFHGPDRSFEKQGCRASFINGVGFMERWEG